MTSTDAQVSRLAAALDNQLEADKEFEARIKAILDPSSPLPAPSAVVSPPLSPSIPPSMAQVFEDRYAKGWSDAWESIKPQLYELHRRYVVASESRWVKWLPIICFGCTLFGFVLGWCASALGS
jgi:hypothetical protein